MSDTLYLPLKGKWFDLIKAGKKSFEYRLYNEYWKKRLIDRDYKTLILTRGYPRRDDMERRIELPYRGYTIKLIQSEEFGVSDKPGTILKHKVFAIFLTKDIRC